MCIVIIFVFNKFKAHKSIRSPLLFSLSLSPHPLQTKSQKLADLFVSKLASVISISIFCTSNASEVSDRLLYYEFGKSPICNVVTCNFFRINPETFHCFLLSSKFFITCSKRSKSSVWMCRTASPCCSVTFSWKQWRCYHQCLRSTLTSNGSQYFQW